MSTVIKPKWAIAPPWAKYLAQDGDGTWYWYSERPVPSSSGTRVWIRKTTTTQQQAADNDYNAWEDTLERKP